MELQEQEQPRGKQLLQARSRSLLEPQGPVVAVLHHNLVPGLGPALITDGGAQSQHRIDMSGSEAAFLVP